MADYIDIDLVISHDDPIVIERIVSAYKSENLFEEFIPCPKELVELGNLGYSENDKATGYKMIEKYGARDESDWCEKKWGSGYCGIGDCNIISPTKIKLCFQTKWFPPLPILDHWVDLGCHVEGVFFNCQYDELEAYKDKSRLGPPEEFEIPDDFEPIIERLVALIDDAQADTVDASELFEQAGLKASPKKKTIEGEPSGNYGPILVTGDYKGDPKVLAGALKPLIEHQHDLPFEFKIYGDKLERIDAPVRITDTSYLADISRLIAPLLKTGTIELTFFKKRGASKGNVADNYYCHQRLIVRSDGSVEFQCLHPRAVDCKVKGWNSFRYVDGVTLPPVLILEQSDIDRSSIN